jgi:hypothetical protein
MNMGGVGDGTPGGVLSATVAGMSISVDRSPLT